MKGGGRYIFRARKAGPARIGKFLRRQLKGKKLNGPYDISVSVKWPTPTPYFDF